MIEHFKLLFADRLFQYSICCKTVVFIIFELISVVSTNVVSICEKKRQNKKFLRQLDESLINFVIRSHIAASIAENKTVETRNNGLCNNSVSATLSENNASHTQVTERKITDRVRKEVDGVFAAVENRVPDAILTAMDSVYIPRIEVAVRSITGLLGHGPDVVVQNSEQRDFSWNMEGTPLTTAFYRTDSNVTHNRYDETRISENIEDGDVPALKPI